MTTSLGSQPPHGQRGRRESRRGSGIAVLVVIIVVGAAALAVLLFWLTGSTDESNAAPSPAASTAATATEGSATTDTAGCPPLPSSGDAVPVLPPEDARWELVGRIAAPTAPEIHGPARTDPVRSCFAHTPTGVLYAAINILATTTLPGGYEQLTGPLAAGGPGREEAARRLASEPAETSQDGTSIQIAGFSFLGYTAEEATVDLAAVSTTPAASGYVHVPLTLRWDATGGDWKVVYPDSGELFAGVGTIPSLVGYVPWSGT